MKLLSVKQLTKSYQGQKTAINNISFELNQGNVWVLSGKAVAARARSPVAAANRDDR